MKIIKEGTPKSQRSVQLTCPDCGCVFEVNQEEFTFYSGVSYRKHWVIICPTEGCGNEFVKYEWE